MCACTSVVPISLSSTLAMPRLPFVAYRRGAGGASRATGFARSRACVGRQPLQRLNGVARQIPGAGGGEHIADVFGPRASRAGVDAEIDQRPFGAG